MTKQKKYWKGLAELVNDPVVDKLKENEFIEENQDRKDDLNLLTLLRKFISKKLRK